VYRRFWGIAIYSSGQMQGNSNFLVSGRKGGSRLP
jgi:hypothetical protein